jgi:preprotein translocase subunit SecE
MKEWSKQIRSYLKETQGEVKKVAWPDRQYVTAATFIILVICIVMGLGVTLLDWGLAKIILFLNRAF